MLIDMLEEMPPYCCQAFDGKLSGFFLGVKKIGTRIRFGAEKKRFH